MLKPLLSDHQVAKITGRARSTLQKDRVSGAGIPFIRIGRLVRYRLSDVRDYIDGLPALRSTSQTTCRKAPVGHASNKRKSGAPGERQPGPLVGVVTEASSAIDAFELDKERPPPSEMAHGRAAR